MNDNVITFDRAQSTMIARVGPLAIAIMIGLWFVLKPNTFEDYYPVEFNVSLGLLCILFFGYVLFRELTTRRSISYAVKISPSSLRIRAGYEDFDLEWINIAGTKIETVHGSRVIEVILSDPEREIRRHGLLARATAFTFPGSPIEIHEKNIDGDLDELKAIIDHCITSYGKKAS